MVYLKMLGMELGYLKTKDMEEMAYSAALMIDNLLKMFPTEVSLLKTTHSFPQKASVATTFSSETHFTTCQCNKSMLMLCSSSRDC